MSSRRRTDPRRPRESDVYRGSSGTEDAGRPPTPRQAEPPSSSHEIDLRPSAATGDDSASIERELVENLRRLIACDTRVGEVAEAITHRLAIDAAKERNQARADFEKYARGKRGELARQWSTLEMRVDAQVASLAPGTASGGWDAACWRRAPASHRATPTFYRLGALELPAALKPQAAEMSFLLPLLNSTGLVFQVNQAAQTSADRLLQSLLLRVMGSVRAGRLEISVFDPRLRGPVSVFSGVRHEAPDLLRETMTAPEALTATLQKAVESVRRVADLLSQNNQDNLTGLQDALGSFVAPHRVIVVLDYPLAIDEQINRMLLTLAQSGPRRGVTLLIQSSERTKAQHGVDRAELSKHLLSIQPVGDSRWQVPSISPLNFVADSPPPHDLLEALCTQIAKNTASVSLPVLALEALLPPIDEMGRSSSLERLTATIGRSGSRPVTIDLSSSNPARPNLLLGGAVGQGKSNLLLVLLHSWCAHYAPSELELFLLDYKEGVEFARLGPSGTHGAWLPHLRVLGIESDRDFGLAVLRHLLQECQRRSVLFKAEGRSNITDYRRASRATLPRIVLVIDEFQVLFEGDSHDAEEAVRLLEQLARTGRGFGVHLVLSSQTLSGIQSLGLKEDSIFGQFPWRIALKTTANDSQTLLGQGNRAASTLRFRGEAIVNGNFGEVAGNQRSLIAYAADDAMARLRRHIFSRASSPTPPVIVRGGEPVRYQEAFDNLRRDGRAEPAGSRDREAWVGLPVAVVRQPVCFQFYRARARTLALIGEGRDEALGMISSAVLSLAARPPADGAVFIIVDFTPVDDGVESAGARLAAQVQRLGQRAEVIPSSAAGARLAAMKEVIEGRLEQPREIAGDVYLVLIGVQQAIGLNREDPERFQSPLDALRFIIEDGALARHFVIAWWGSYRTYTKDLGFELREAVQGLSFLRCSQADVQSELGPFARWSPRPFRALFWDRGRAGEPTLVVPFEAVHDEHIMSWSSVQAQRRQVD